MDEDDWGKMKWNELRSKAEISQTESLAVGRDVKSCSHPAEIEEVGRDGGRERETGRERGKRKRERGEIAGRDGEERWERG